MKVSIITVCLNSEKTIEKTILSVLAQECEELEYIIIDGKSTDGTLEIVKKYEERISVVVSEPDAGLYDAMNKGIAYATGDVIGIINSDDWYEPDAVKTVLDIFKNSNAEVVYGQMNLIDGDRKVRVFIPEDIEKLRYKMVLTHPTVFIRRDVYSRYGGFDIKYKVCADYELLLRLYTKNVCFQYVERVLANFRTNGISSQMSMNTVNDARAIATKYLYFVSDEKKKYYEEQIENRYRQNFFQNKLFEDESSIWSILQKKNLLNNDIPVAVWGTGKWGKQMECLLKHRGLDICCFIDNNKSKWNTTECGIAVKKPDFLKFHRGIVLIMVCDYSKEIAAQIEKMNNLNVKYVSWEELTDDLVSI